jgi:uncharacterized membrane protein YbhN (UPF0104 family)
MNARLVVGRLAIGIMASVVACLVLLQVVDLPVTASRLRLASPAWLLIPLVALATQFLLRAWRWSLLLSASATSVAVGRAAGPLAIGYLANAVLPARLGEVARAVVLARREHLAIGSVAASVVVERAVDLAALLAIGILSTGIESMAWVSAGATVTLLVGLGALVYLAPFISEHLPRRLPVRLRDTGSYFLLGVAGVHARTMLAALLISALAWVGDIAVVWAGARAIGTDLSLAAAVAIAVGAVLATAVPAASGYVGTYELGAVAIGSLAGTPPDTILAIALLSHVFAVVPTGLLGLVVALRMGIRFEIPFVVRASRAAARAEAARR